MTNQLLTENFCYFTFPEDDPRSDTLTSGASYFHLTINTLLDGDTTCNEPTKSQSPLRALNVGTSKFGSRRAHVITNNEKYPTVVREREVSIRI
jgi:hypothetical protein